MIVIRCHECKRRYNWAGDAFCPHCGAFNQAKDYGFDRERINVEWEEPEQTQESVFHRKPPKMPSTIEETVRKATKKRDVSEKEASGCLKKIIIAIVVWQVGFALLGLLSNLLFRAL